MTPTEPLANRRTISALFQGLLQRVRGKPNKPLRALYGSARLLAKYRKKRDARNYRARLARRANRGRGA